jgi:hypothetical protein
MSSSSADTSSPVAKWRAARRLYPIYCALAVQFGLDTPPYENLDDAGAQSDPNFLPRVQAWFDTIDSRLHVAQFRQLLLGTAIASSEEKLQALIERHNTKQEKTESDRDKLDFLLVQYFAVCSPPTLSDELRMEDAAEVLTPVLGPVTAEVPEWLRPLEAWVDSLSRFTSLRELQESQLVQQGRQLKASAKHLYFSPSALVAFTRFSYLLRRTFFQLINAELRAINAGLEKLAKYGQSVLDCSAAQMSATTSVADLRRFFETYKKPLLPEYSVDTSILRLIQLRQIVDAALAEIEQPDDPIVSEIEERCRRVEAELIAMRKLAAGLAAERKRSLGSSKAAERSTSVFEEVPDVAINPAAAPSVISDDEPLGAVIEAVAEPPTAHATPPEITVAEAPEAPPQAPDTSLTDAMEEIRKKLAAAPRKGISSLNIAGTALLLSPDEVEAFIRPKDAASIDLQRSLAARALLLQAVEMQKRSAAPELLSKTIQLCRSEAASIQQHSVEAKQSNNSGTAATLNASASQLLSLLRQVERKSHAS